MIDPKQAFKENSNEQKQTILVDYEEVRHLSGLAQKLYDKHLQERNKEEIDLNNKEHILFR